MSWDMLSTISWNQTLPRARCTTWGGRDLIALQTLGPGHFGRCGRSRRQKQQGQSDAGKGGHHRDSGP